VPFADHLIRDAQYGLRLLRRSPIFTTVAIVSLALGIGANAAIVQLIDTIALRRLAIVNAEQLAEVGPDGPQAFGSYDGVNSKATYPLWELIRLNPAIAIQSVELKAQIRERLTGERTIAWLAGSLGILAMVLVIVGLYGLIAYLVVSRRHEIGLRLALGSTRARIVLLVLRDNVWSTGAGLAIGLPLAVAAMRGARTLLFGLTPTDVPTVLGATGLLASASVLAAALPAWRAARIRPDVALRSD
jgi:hypothetical protein